MRTGLRSNLIAQQEQMATDIPVSDLQEYVAPLSVPPDGGLTAKGVDEISLLDLLIVLAERKRTIFLGYRGLRDPGDRRLVAFTSTLHGNGDDSATTAELILERPIGFAVRRAGPGGCVGRRWKQLVQEPKRYVRGHV